MAAQSWRRLAPRTNQELAAFWRRLIRKTPCVHPVAQQIRLKRKACRGGGLSATALVIRAGFAKARAADRASGLIKNAVEWTSSPRSLKCPLGLDPCRRACTVGLPLSPDRSRPCVAPEPRTLRTIIQFQVNRASHALERRRYGESASPRLARFQSQTGSRSNATNGRPIAGNRSCGPFAKNK